MFRHIIETLNDFMNCTTFLFRLFFSFIIRRTDSSTWEMIITRENYHSSHEKGTSILFYSPCYGSIMTAFVLRNGPLDMREKRSFFSFPSNIIFCHCYQFFVEGGHFLFLCISASQGTAVGKALFL